jgi:hypothetical protein
LTLGSAAFWIYLGAYSGLGGVTGLVLGLIARLTARPYETPQRFRVFLGLLVGVALMGVIASALSYNLALKAGAFASFRVTSLVWPFIAGMVIFIWASGFPLSRIVHLRS